MFKKAGWTIVKPPTPLIPDGQCLNDDLQLIQVSRFDLNTTCLCLRRPPPVDVLQMAVHECPDVG